MNKYSVPPAMRAMQLCLLGLGNAVYTALTNASVYRALEELGTATVGDLAEACGISPERHELLRHMLMNQLGMGALVVEGGVYKLSPEFAQVSKRLSLGRVSLMVAAKIVADPIMLARLETGMTVSKFTEMLQMSAVEVEKALMVFTALGILDKEGDYVMFEDAVSQFFKHDAVPTFAGLIKYFAFRIKFWDRLPLYMRGTAFDPWPYTGKEWRWFSDAVAQVTYQTTKVLPSLLKLKPGNRFVDLGSGLGGMARSMKSVHNCDVLLVDLPPVLVNVNDLPVFACNITMAMPTFLPGDIAFMANISHVMGDENLQSIFSRIKSDRLVVVDFILDPAAPSVGHIMSVEFLTTAGEGGNRTLEQYAGLLAPNWEIMEVVQIAGPVSMIVCERA